MGPWEPLEDILLPLLSPLSLASGHLDGPSLHLILSWMSYLHYLKSSLEETWGLEDPGTRESGLGNGGGTAVTF